LIKHKFEHSLALPFFGIGIKTDLFQPCGHCWVFQICWHIECSTFTASSFSIWNSWTGIPSPPFALFVVMLSKVQLTSHSRRLYTWTSPDGEQWNQIDYILCSQRWISSIQSAKTRPGTDCGSNHEHLIAKFRLKLKKVGKTTRPFRYDLNQNPYHYILEVTNRFKGLDLIEYLKNYSQRFKKLYRRQGLRQSPRKRNAKSQNGCLSKPYK